MQTTEETKLEVRVIRLEVRTMVLALLLLATVIVLGFTVVIIGKLADREINLPALHQGTK